MGKIRKIATDVIMLSQEEIRPTYRRRAVVQPGVGPLVPGPTLKF